MDDYSNSFTIAWEDRLNKDLLYDVGERCFYIARLQKDLDDKLITEKFLSAYDFIEFLYKTLNNGQKVRIDGVLQYTYYNGEIQTRKIINKIQLASDEAALQATYSQMFLINKDSIGKREKEKKRIPVYAYVPEYVSKYDSIPVKETVLMPRIFIFTKMILLHLKLLSICLRNGLNSTMDGLRQLQQWEKLKRE